MKVSELIEKLKAFPPDAYVVVTDSSCCGCSAGDIDSIGLDGEDVFIDGDRHAMRNRPAAGSEGK